jgi:hypothetical protein
MDHRGRRFREAVVVSQEPFRPNVRLICQVLTEMGLAVAVASSPPPAADGPDAAAEPPGGGHVRGTLAQTAVVAGDRSLAGRCVASIPSRGLGGARGCGPEGARGWRAKLMHWGGGWGARRAAGRPGRARGPVWG